MVNDVVETTFMDALKCAVADVEYNKKQEMCLLIQNFFVVVVKGVLIQALIGRLDEREVNQEGALASLRKRLS